MVAPACIRFVLHASLIVARTPMVEIESLGSKKCDFICDLTLFIIMVMELDTDFS